MSIQMMFSTMWTHAQAHTFSYFGRATQEILLLPHNLYFGAFSLSLFLLAPFSFRPNKYNNMVKFLAIQFMIYSAYWTQPSVPASTHTYVICGVKGWEEGNELKRFIFNFKYFVDPKLRNSLLPRWFNNFS